MQPAFDLQNLNKRLDTLDAKGPLSRGHQSSWAMLQAILSFLREIQNPDPVTGTVTSGEYLLSEDWAEADRATYETAVDTALADVATAMAELKTIVKA
jgi:hypothetical protein